MNVRTQGIHRADDHRPPAPPGVELLGADQVSLVQPAVRDPPVQPAPAEPGAEGVAHRVSGDGRDEGSDGQQDHRHTRPVAGRHQPGAEQDGVAGKQEPDEQARLDEDEPEDHGVDRGRGEGAEVGREVREDVEGRGHPAKPRVAAMREPGAEEVGVGPWVGRVAGRPAATTPSCSPTATGATSSTATATGGARRSSPTSTPRRHDFHVAIENWQHDFNIGTVVRTANAFLAGEVHIVGSRRWNRRGAMVTDRYQHVRHHRDVADAARPGRRSRALPCSASTTCRARCRWRRPGCRGPACCCSARRGRGCPSRPGRPCRLARSRSRSSARPGRSTPGRPPRVAMHTWVRQHVAGHPF